MRLVIAEKPSLARAIASALGVTGRSGGALVGKGWAVVACRGHVLELKDPDGYEDRPWGSPWDVSALPMLPDPMPLVPSREDGAAEALAAIRRELDRDGLEEVVHAGDADREGEGIVRRVLEWHPVPVPVTRLWARSVEEGEIRRAMDAREADSAYDDLADAARGRAELDWLVGLNVTRALTCLYGNGRVVHAGRVVTPVLRLVAERTRVRRQFKRVPFWSARATCGELALDGPRRDSREGAEADVDSLEGATLTVASVVRKERRTKAPLLHDILTLEQQASKVLGLKASECDEALQALYEAGLVTYPRTDARVIPASDLAALEGLLSSGLLPSLAGAPASWRPGPPDPARVVGETGGHSALLPTTALDEEAMGRLPERQAGLSRLVCARVLVACCPDACVEVSETLRATSPSGLELSWKGSHETCAGWRDVERACGISSGVSDPKELPVGIVEGSELAVGEVTVREGSTEPPKAYTTETLLSAMEHADRLVDGDDAESLKARPTHSGGLGTPATRSDTLSKLEAFGYLEYRGKQIQATDLGLAVDAMAPSQLASVALTARVERALSSVESGDLPLDDFRAQARSWASSLVDDARSHVRPELALAPAPGSGPHVVGRCPRCGSDVVVSRSGATYFCQSRKGHRDRESGEYVVDEEGCGFLLGKVMGHALTEREASALLAGKAVALRGLKTKAGKSLSARARLDAEAPGGVRLEFGRDGATGGAKGARKGRGGRR